MKIPVVTFSGSDLDMMMLGVIPVRRMTLAELLDEFPPVDAAD